MKTPARIAYEAALKSVKRGRFPIAPAMERTVDGIVFDSKREAQRYAELKIAERAGIITHLELQPEYIVRINGEVLCKAHFDFRYFRDGDRIVEDVKSSGTAKDTAYRLRRRAVELQYHIKVVEV